MSCGVGHRHGSGPMFLWLWPRPAVAARIGPLAWEPPYPMGMTLRRQKDKKKKKGGSERQEENENILLKSDR